MESSPASAPSGSRDPAVDPASRTFAPPASAFEVVFLSRPRSLLPCHYFISLEAVFPLVRAHNWGIAAIIEQIYFLFFEEMCRLLG